MLNLALYGSYFILLVIFLIAAQLRSDLIASFATYLMIIFPSVIPFVHIIVEQRKEEREKAKKIMEEQT
ncbi:MAG: hypothetical protein LKI94_11625 [Sporolactobacillus sp.]|jgi:uncharacterized membrane-anchored protein YitT (DUF2179 family)|nr:hypothetical protein [Sporolactobacillus sp.]